MNKSGLIFWLLLAKADAEIIGYWPFTGRVNDYGPNSIPVTVKSASGVPKFTTGANGESNLAVRIGSGGNDHLLLKSPSLNLAGRSLTVSFFHRRLGNGDYNADATFIFEWEQPSVWRWHMQNNLICDNSFWMNNKANNLNFDNCDGNPIDWGDWNFWVITYNHSIGWYKIFKDLDLIHSVAGPAPEVGYTIVNIGSRTDWTFQNDAAFSHFFIGDHIINDEEMEKQYQRGINTNSNGCSLLGKWSLNKANGLAEASDSSLNGQAISNDGLPVFTTGPNGDGNGAVQVGPTGNLLLFRSSQLSIIEKSFTINLFVKALGSVSQSQTIWNWECSTCTDSQGLLLETSAFCEGSISLRNAPDTLGNGNDCIQSGDLSQWTFLSVSFDSYQRLYKVSVNSEEQWSSTDYSTSDTSGTDLVIGGFTGQPSFDFHGAVACMSIYLKVLTSEELKSLQNECEKSTSDSASSIGFWPLNSMYGLQDIGPNQIPALLQSMDHPNFTEGPSGAADSALVIGPIDNFIIINSSNVAISEESFTISIYVKLLNEPDPNSSPPSVLWEWSDGANDENVGLHLASNNICPQSLWLNDNLMGDGIAFPKTCNNHGLNFTGWQFITLTYDKISRMYRLYNDNLQVIYDKEVCIGSTRTNFPQISIGARSIGGVDTFQAHAAVACFSVHLYAMSMEEIANQKTLCHNLSPNIDPYPEDTNECKIHDAVEEVDFCLEPGNLSPSPVAELEKIYPNIIEKRNYPYLTGKGMLELCDHFSAGRLIPPMEEVLLTEVTVFGISRIIEYDMFTENMKVFAGFRMKWSVKTCNKMSLLEKFGRVESLEKIYAVTKEMVWTPNLEIGSGFVEESEHQEDDLLVTVKPNHFKTTPNQTLDFYLTKMGFFETNCQANLHLFPFDQATCTFKFLLNDQKELVQFNNTITICPNDGPTEWKFVECHSPTVSYEQKQSKNVSVALFSIRMERNPVYYLVNLVLPNMALSFLILSTFLIPPIATLRPLLAITLMLAVTVAHEQLIQQIPRKSGSIFLRDFTQSLMWLSAVITLYHIFASFLSHRILPVATATGKNIKFWKYDRIIGFVTVILFFVNLIYFTAFILSSNI